MAAQGHGPRWIGIHSHQKRVGQAKLLEFAQNLSGTLSKLKQATNFKELHDIIAAKKINGVGELTIYDTALRIGAILKFEPTQLYCIVEQKKELKLLAFFLEGENV